MISSWKLKYIVPKDCSHWTPSTTSTPPIGMESIGLFNTYSPMDNLILWHFPKQFIIPPLAIITWNFGVGYRKQFNYFAILQGIKLWVLLESINTITFFLMVWGVGILAMHYKIWLVSFILYLGFFPWVYPLLLTFIVPFLLPLRNLCRIISSQHTYYLQCIFYHNYNKAHFLFFFQFFWCQPYRLWKGRGNNTSIFIVVGVRLPGCHNFSFHFSC